jgi:hypothetical protein
MNHYRRALIAALCLAGIAILAGSLGAPAGATGAHSTSGREVASGHTGMAALETCCMPDALRMWKALRRQKIEEAAHPHVVPRRHPIIRGAQRCHTFGYSA